MAKLQVIAATGSFGVNLPPAIHPKTVFLKVGPLSPSEI